MVSNCTIPRRKRTTLKNYTNLEYIQFKDYKSLLTTRTTVDKFKTFRKDCWFINLQSQPPGKILKQVQYVMIQVTAKGSS